MADIEVERRIEFWIVELHQHVGAAYPDLRAPEGHEGRNIERADTNHIQHRVIGREAQPTRILVQQVRRRVDPGAVQ